MSAGCTLLSSTQLRTAATCCKAGLKRQQCGRMSDRKPLKRWDIMSCFTLDSPDESLGSGAMEDSPVKQEGEAVSVPAVAVGVDA